MLIKLLLLVVSSFLLEETMGHGMLLSPAGRSSAWRFDPTAPVNWDDDSNYCGGYYVQWGQHGGKCGVCGDVYNKPHPQDNENTGKYGRGKVMGTYQSGSVITTTVKLTVNHRGTFEYHLCNLSNPNSYEPESCFTNLQFEDGSTVYKISGGSDFKNRIRLPPGLKCERCVLRWHYRAGNNWGQCEDGSEGMGCGPQETFRSCADISIV